MSYNDDFDDPPRNRPFVFLGAIGPKVAFLAVLIALSFMVGVVWKLYVGADDGDAQNIPIVRADEEGFKVVPDDPGGMEIPHQDSTIFSSLKAKNEEDGRSIENLLSNDEEEQPLPRSQLFAGLNTDTPATSDINSETAEPAPKTEAVKPMPISVPEEDIVEDAEAEEAVAPEKLKLAVPEKVEPTPAAKPKAEVAEKTSEPVSLFPEKKASALPATGDYYIQLGSVTSRDGAEAEWKKIAAKYSAQLSGYSHRVQTADLGAKGTFYRIQAGPVSKDDAVTACEAIKKVTPGGCLLQKD